MNGPTYFMQEMPGLTLSISFKPGILYCNGKKESCKSMVVLIDMDAMPTLSNIDDNGEPKAKKVDCSIKDPNDIMRLMGEGFDLREPIDDKLDSWYMGEYFKRFILTDPPPRFADEVKDIIKRLMGR
ncbi:hypothetical protein SARC_16103 [Sphaeroforma arctica JP610]|uniref:Uncharacterized protein n=1 Tax=Sphaeroforma arctica JP610 TaxID=667725 RepID=A0A0L0F3Q3_9EUKA|nr:hypothetical protein SARC_16103 [Sphaeroforma arctica JP610]KNC71360.1 hypothetical protein SARC_16103 [Sphaeroforma arctica JP610]|eukprot:XP_014145262.1 hypothetical protein SARC_16103 [Sphaeroforma arctica JP610]